MKNLQTHKDGPYYWTSVEVGRGIKFSVDYWKNAPTRGIWVSAYPVECQARTDVQGKPFVQEIIEITSGFSSLVLPLERKSLKSLVGFAEFVDEVLPAVARAFLECDKNAARGAMASLIERWRTLHTQEQAKKLESVRS